MRAAVDRSIGFKRNSVVLGLAAVVLMAIAGLSYMEWSRYRTANLGAARTGDILDSTERVLSRILDAETGQRGFLLTGEDRYLEPYNEARQALPRELATLNSLLAPNTRQAANLGPLNQAIGRKMSELEQTIDLRRTRGATPALQVMLSGQGKDAMDQVRAALSVIQSGATAEQKEASVNREIATQTVLLVAVAGSLLLLFLFIAGLDPILSRDPRAVNHPHLIAYGLPVAVTAVALLLRLALTSAMGPIAGPSLFLLPAVLFAAWYGGFRAGAVTVLLSALASAFFALGNTRLERPAQAVSLLFFMFIGLGIALLTHSQRQALDRADREAANRRAAEESEREQRQRFETTLASIGDAVIATDAEGKITFVNQVACELLRDREASLLGKPLDSVFRIVNEHTRAPVESPVAKVLSEGHIAGLANHTILIAADGTETPIEDSGAPVRDANGVIDGVVLVFRDIAQRRAAEKLLAHQAAELSESESQFRTLANAIPQLAWMTKADGYIFWFNDRWYEYTGASPQDSEGWGWQAFHDPQMLPEVLERWHASISTETPFDMVFPLRGVDGIYRPFLTRIIPLRDSEGKIVRWLGTNTDISEQRRVEEALRASETGLQRLNAELARSNEDLQRFAFVASHDLQEPLRMITSYAQLLVRKYPGETDQEARLIVNNIVDGTTRMRSLLTDLLAYAEIGSSFDRPSEPVDLNFVIDRVRENLKESIQESGAVIACGPLPSLAVEDAHLVPLFQNLASNAIKYRKNAPPRIHVGVEEVASEFRFAVSDNGIGIDPQHHQRIFDVFQRLHGRDVPGTGLGLAICKRVVERYGGRIWVESQPGSGSTFFFTLPACRGRRETERSNPSADRATM
jgi:PAS domain S-box-containing protein